MLAKALAVIKTLMIMVIAGAVIVASFYAAYLLLFLVVLAVVGSCAYIYFSWDDIVQWYESDD